MAETSQSNTTNQLPNGETPIIMGANHEESSTTEPPPEEEPTLYIYYLENREHVDYGTNNSAIVIAEDETQARRVANNALKRNEGGYEFTMSDQPNFWELDEFASIQRIGTADEGQFARLLNYNWTGD